MGESDSREHEGDTAVSPDADNTTIAVPHQAGPPEQEQDQETVVGTSHTPPRGSSHHHGQPGQGPPDQGLPYQGQPWDPSPREGRPPDQETPSEGSSYGGTAYGGPSSYGGAAYQGQPYQGQPYQGTAYQGQPYQGTSYDGAGYPGAPGGYGTDAPGPDDGRTRRRRRTIIAAVAAAVVLVLIVTTVVLVVRGAPGRTVGEAADGVRSWPGVTYHGQVADASGPATVELTVDGQGNGVGSITRVGGGHADLVVTPTVQAIRGDAAWWARSAPRSSLAVRLTDRWVSDARDQLAGVVGWSMSPAQLAQALSTEDRWSGGDSRQFGGVSADTYLRGGDQALIDDSGPRARLVGVDLGSFGGRQGDPVGVEQAAPEAVGRATGAASQLPVMRDYTYTVTEPARVSTNFTPRANPCETETCTVDATIVSGNDFPVGGNAQFTKNDRPVASVPFTVAPGASVTFPISYPNSATPGTTVNYTGRVVPVDTN